MRYAGVGDAAAGRCLVGRHGAVEQPQVAHVEGAAAVAACPRVAAGERDPDRVAVAVAPTSSTRNRPVASITAERAPAPATEMRPLAKSRLPWS